MRIKSFGLVEAMIASFIAITVLSGAVALANSINKSTTIDSSYSQAEKIADNFLENVSFANSTGIVFFDDRGSSMVDQGQSSKVFSINCFDSLSAAICKTQYDSMIFPDEMGFYWDNRRTQIDNSDTGYYRIVAGEIGNIAFGNDFFKIKTTVNHFKDSAGQDACPSIASVAITADKCRVIDVEIKWTENTGDRSYKVSRYITDWTR